MAYFYFDKHFLFPPLAVKLFNYYKTNISGYIASVFGMKVDNYRLRKDKKSRVLSFRILKEVLSFLLLVPDKIPVFLIDILPTGFFVIFVNILEIHF